MPTVEVDLIFFLITLIISIFSFPFISAWTIYKGYRNPEFWLRLRRQDWVYIVMKNPLGRLLTIVKPTREIGENGRIKLFRRRTYFLRDQDESGHPSVHPGKKNKATYFMTWWDPFPQAWVPGNSITSDTNPDTINEIEDNNIMKQLMTADFTNAWMMASLILSVVAILVVGASIFVMIGIGNTATHSDCILRAGNNATLAAACH